MKAVFVELPAFARHRAEYLDDDAFAALQALLMTDPDVGVVIQGTGGLRKLRFGDARRGKGKRGGLRVIYFWWRPGPECWLFTVFDKDQMTDLTAAQRAFLHDILRSEISSRTDP